MCLREKESPYEGDSERNTSKQTAEEGASLTRKHSKIVSNYRS